MDINAVKAYMNQWMEENKQEFYTAADEIWAYPELGLEETRAFGILTGLLKKYGFAVESGTGRHAYRLCGNVWHGTSGGGDQRGI